MALLLTPMLSLILCQEKSSVKFLARKIVMQSINIISLLPTCDRSVRGVHCPPHKVELCGMNALFLAVEDMPVALAIHLLFLLRPPA